MPSISTDARFLGVDIALLWRDIREPWRNVHQWPLLAWLTPQPPVLLLQADGQQSLWVGGRQVSASSTAARFRAIELPDDLVLRRSVQLPAVASEDAHAALELEARSNSPFESGDLAWGYHLQQAKGTQAVQRAELVLVSRKQVAQHLADISTHLSGQSFTQVAAEVWVLTAQGQPVVLSGYGERAREAFGASRRRIGYGLLATLALASAVLAITPTVQLRARALEAAQAHTELVKGTAAVVHRREQLLSAVEALGALSELTSGRIEPLRVLDKLTQVLPDDTALQSLKLQGNKLIFSGQTSNASALMQRLGDVQGFKDVRAPTATNRLANIGKDVFAVELNLDPEVFGVKSTQLVSPLLPAASAASALVSARVAPSIAAPAPGAGAASAASAPSTGASAPVASASATSGSSAPKPASAASAASAAPGVPSASSASSALPGMPVQTPSAASSRKGAPS